MGCSISSMILLRQMTLSVALANGFNWGLRRLDMYSLLL